MDLKHFKAYVHSEGKVFPVNTIYTNNEGIKAIEIIGRIKPVWAINAGRKDVIPTNRVQANNFTLLVPTGKCDEAGQEIYQGDFVHTTGQQILEVKWNTDMLQWYAGDCMLGVLDNILIIGNKYEGGMHDNKN